MKQFLQNIILCFTLLGSSFLTAEQNILLNFRPLSKSIPPQLEIHSVIDTTFKVPKKIDGIHLKKASGILGVLNGQASITDTDGQMVFSRGTITDTFNILISDSLRPIVYHPNTVYGFTITEPESSAMYTAKRVQEDGVNKWNIKEATLPANLLLPPDTIVLFGKPDDLIIPVGTFITHGDPHLIFPDIFAKPGITAPGAYLQFLKHSRLYRLTKKVYKEAQTMASVIYEE